MAAARGSSRSSTGDLPRGCPVLHQLPSAAWAETPPPRRCGPDTPPRRCTRRDGWSWRSTMMFTAMSRSAYSSTYTWQIPVPVWMQGTVAFSTQARISPAPPRGISRSTSPSAVISSRGALRGWCPPAGSRSSGVAADRRAMPCLAGPSTMAVAGAVRPPCRSAGRRRCPLFSCQGRRVGGDVGAALVDDGHQPQWAPRALRMTMPLGARRRSDRTLPTGSGSCATWPGRPPPYRRCGPSSSGQPVQHHVGDGDPVAAAISSALAARIAAVVVPRSAVRHGRAGGGSSVCRVRRRRRALRAALVLPKISLCGHLPLLLCQKSGADRFVPPRCRTA